MTTSSRTRDARAGDRGAFDLARQTDEVPCMRPMIELVEDHNCRLDCVMDSSAAQWPTPRHCHDLDWLDWVAVTDTSWMRS